MRIRFMIVVFFTVYTKRREDCSSFWFDDDVCEMFDRLETTGLLAEVAANHALLSGILSDLADRLSWALVVLVA